MKQRRIHSFVYFLMIMALILLSGPLASCAPLEKDSEQPAMKAIRVAMDNNYPPYVFQDESGVLHGILVDQWQLWEERTGVEVEIVALPWADAMAGMKAGKFDVIDTIFYTEERAGLYDFTESYANINVRIFFHKNISGLASADDLRGFRVAVKAGDANAEYLFDRGIKDLVYYDSYEKIIEAVSRQEETVFVIDEPPGFYFLYKYGVQDQFNYSEPLYGGQFHRAVKKGDTALLNLVNKGFADISPAEYTKINDRWFGVAHQGALDQFTPFLSVAAAIIVLAIIALFTFNRILQSRVKKRTIELQNAVSDLQISETRFRDAIEFLPIPISIADREGQILVINHKFREQYGYTIDDTPTVASWMARAYPDPEYRQKVLAIWKGDVTLAGSRRTTTPLREYRVTCKDGTHRDVEIVMHPAGELWVTTFNNITERKQAEETLRIFKESVENSSDAIGMSTAEGKHYYQNQAFSQLFGQVGEDPPSTLYVHENIGKQVFDTIKTGEQWVGEVQMYAKDRSILTIYLRAYANKDDHGRVVGLVGIHTDISERKKIEDALRENEIIFSSFLENSPVYVFFKDKDIRSLRLSRNYEQMLGMPLGQALGKNMDELFPGDLAKSIVEDDKRILKEGQLVLVEEELNGRVYETTKFPVYIDGSPEMLAGFTVDITERKRAQEALLQSERKYRSLIETLNVGIFVTTLNGKFLQANSALAKMYGYDNLDEFMKLRAQKLYAHVSDRKNIVTQLHKHGFVRNKEIVSTRKDGSTFWISLSAVLQHNEAGQATGLLGSISDITERKRSEELIQKSEKRFRSLIENSNDALTLLAADGTVLYEGPTVGRITGYDPNERVGKNSLESIYPDDLPLVQKTFESLLASAGNVVTARFRSVKRDGTIWWTEANSTNLLHEPNVQAIVVNYRDVTERKKAEDALRESEERFRQVVEASPMGMHMYQLYGDRLVFIGSNPAADRILGIDNTQFIGKNIEDAFPSLAATEIPERYRLAARQGIPWDQIQVDYNEGNIHGAFEIHVFQTGQDRVVVMFLDITDRKKAETALLKSEKRNRAIVTALPDLLFQVSADHVFLDCVANDPNLLLQPPDQLVGRTMEEIFPPYLAELTVGKLHAALETGEMQIFEYSLFVNNKDRFFECRMTQLDADSVLALVRNITESKQIEEALRESEQRYRTLFEHANDAIFVETQDDQILDVNEHACQMLGYTREELLSLHVTDLIAPEVHRQRRAIRSELSEYGRKPFESLDVCKDGTRITVEVTNSILPNGLALSIVRNITERKQAENELRKREREVRKLNADLERRVIERTSQLEIANKELEAFAYSVSHDLRAPLRAIDGFSRILMEDFSGQMNAEAQSLLGRVRDAGQNMSQLVDSLLWLSRMTRAELRRESVDLSLLARKAIENLRQMNPERAVKFSIQSDVSAHGDVRLLGIVLENLLGNAWKFTSKQQEAVVSFGAEQRDGATVYYVRDNGAGFDMAYANKLFGAFQRLHSASEFEGTGIGLATVQRIIHRHGGRIWAESEPNKGATFYFMLG